MATLASFKDLCIDAADPAVVGVFWAKLLGQSVVALDDGDCRVEGPWFPPIWVNRVPEPKTVKNRVHFDLESDSVEPALALGATVINLWGPDWAVLADPEGNEFCVSLDSAHPDTFRSGPPARAFAVCVDSDDSLSQAAWWAEVLGARLLPSPDGQLRWLTGGAGMGELTWKFVPVPEGRTVKNRVHWDVVTDDIEALSALGASVVRPADHQISWTVMADPEGNEFCAFAPSV